MTMGKSKDGYPKFGFSRRNNIAFISVVTSPSGRKKIVVKEIVLTPTEIVGAAAGALGHGEGAVLVAAPGAGHFLEFLSALLINDFDTAAYTVGGNGLVIRQGTTEVSDKTATPNFIMADEDRIISLHAKAVADTWLTANSTLNLKSTAVTQPGTAAGVIRVQLRYIVHPTGLV